MSQVIPGFLCPWNSFQARVLEWVALFSSRESSCTRDWNGVSCSSCTAGECFAGEPKVTTGGKLWAFDPPLPISNWIIWGSAQIGYSIHSLLGVWFANIVSCCIAAFSRFPLLWGGSYMLHHSLTFAFVVKSKPLWLRLMSGSLLLSSGNFMVSHFTSKS